MTEVAKASRMFRDGCACSQAVLAAYGPSLGLPRQQALQIAAGFAGGMRRGDVCGVVTGAFMVLGLRHGSTASDTREGRSEVFGRVEDFAELFKKRNGALNCRDLLGCDISTTEGMKQAQEQDLFKTTCVKMVEDACEILEAMERESQPAVEGDGP